MMLTQWALQKLDAVKDNPRVIIRDPLQLLPEADSAIHQFAKDNGFMAIVASTNLVFRDIYEDALADPEIKKILLIDRTPQSRRVAPPGKKSPPLFYPDLVSDTSREATVELDLRQFLIEKTNDNNWPQDANDPKYAKLIVKNIDNILLAYDNLKSINKDRFTDNDFKKIVAFASLGIPRAAFKKLGPDECWKIGLVGYLELENLNAIVPEITKPINDELKNAEAPFKWLVDQDPEMVVRSFYLSLILQQHSDNWKSMLANIDPVLRPFSDIKRQVIVDAAPKLVSMDPDRADMDLDNVERSLSPEAIKYIMVDQLRVHEIENCVLIIQKEKYSTLIRSLALITALNDLLTGKEIDAIHNSIYQMLFNDDPSKEARFVDNRSSLNWSRLKEAYGMAFEVQNIRDKLAVFLKNLGVRRTEQLTPGMFREAWNSDHINRLEYYVSNLERLVTSGSLLPRAAEELPQPFTETIKNIRNRVQVIERSVSEDINKINIRFQELIKQQYSSWMAKDNDEVILTAQFIRRCLKPYWDSQKEKAVIMIFDGMRYDIWDELLRPMLSDRMDLLADLPGMSLIPSETQLTRKAISAGTYPDEFNSGAAENRLLQNALKKESIYNGEVLEKPGAGTGETVRYKAGNLDVYIFELCDKELHKIQSVNKDGRDVPSRPLAFIYQQQLKNLIDNEVMTIISGLAPGTKVFITADHGFAPVGRLPIPINSGDLNEELDCRYLNCWLKSPVEDSDIPDRMRGDFISFKPSELRMPAKEQSREHLEKTYKSIIFPKVGHALKRRDGRFNPDYFSHGGISIQELTIPMVVLQVKGKDEGLVNISEISGPSEILDGQDIELKMDLKYIGSKGKISQEIRVDIDAGYGNGELTSLEHKVLYVSMVGEEVVYKFKPSMEDATPDERQAGIVKRTFTATVNYRNEYRSVRKLRTVNFSVKLNPDKIVRRVGNLGSVLGLTPRSMR